MAVEQLRDVLLSAWVFQNERKRRCREWMREWRDKQQTAGAAVASGAADVEVDGQEQEPRAASMETQADEAVSDADKGTTEPMLEA